MFVGAQAQDEENTAEEADRGDQGGAQRATAAAAAQPPPPVDVVEAAQAALASLPRGLKSEGDRLVALCEKLVEVSRQYTSLPPNTPSVEGVRTCTEWPVSTD